MTQNELIEKRLYMHELNGYYGLFINTEMQIFSDNLNSIMKVANRLSKTYGELIQVNMINE